MLRNALAILAAACFLTLSATQAFGATWSQTIDDSQAQFSSFDNQLLVASDPSAVGGSYHYINDWGDNNNDASGVVKYQLSGVPAGNNLYHISFSSPSDSTPLGASFGTSGNIAQWHVFNVFADGTESFTQDIPWPGQFQTNRQWLGPNSGYNPGGFTQLGPGPQNDSNWGTDGSLVWMNTSHGQPYISIGFQPFYTAPIAFDAITVTEIIPGDVNFDNIVNGLDIALVASHWLQKGQDIANVGDANYDGIVNGLDIALIASHWLQSAGGGASAAAVPEPSTFVLAGLSIVGLFALRRRVTESRERP
jgi:hypothetical protein